MVWSPDGNRAARELRLPSLVPDVPVADRDQLFAFDRAQATLTPLVPPDQIEQLPRSLETDGIPMPSWRQPGEFVYLGKSTFGTELVLRRGDTERVLSAGWPADTLTAKPKNHWPIEVSRPSETGER